MGYELYGLARTIRPEWRRPRIPRPHLPPIHLPPIVPDHTYVKDNNGHTWRCHGDPDGGREICRGTNTEFRQADCFSQPDSNAGIDYFVTGVCHQMANRILFPAGNYPGAIKVDKAIGYRGSVDLYDEYGTRVQGPTEWETRKRRCMRLESPEELSVTQTLNVVDNKNIEVIDSFSGFDRQLALISLRLFNKHLGIGYDRSKFNLAVLAKIEFWDWKKEIDDMLIRGDIDPLVYADELNFNASQLFRQYVNILGPSDYERLFDIPAYNSFMIIDPMDLVRKYPPISR